MTKIAYIDKRFNRASQELIMIANRIAEDYARRGFDLTLRQLYYQLVSRDVIPNTEKEYKRIGRLISDARLAGLVDWAHIVDRTRLIRSNPHWSDPAQILESAAASYMLDRWENQPFRPEVWIEKDALVGVIARVCERWDVPYFSCRGYNSQSEQWEGARRAAYWQDRGQIPIIFHLGDHDPSGIDMTRDLGARFELFMGGLRVERLALNHDQVEEYKPPPNPAKMTDTRIATYIASFGLSSWELDALDPVIIADLIQSAIEDIIDPAAWDETAEAEKHGKEILGRAADRWEAIEQALAAGEL